MDNYILDTLTVPPTIRGVPLLLPIYTVSGRGNDHEHFLLLLRVLQEVLPSEFLDNIGLTIMSASSKKLIVSLPDFK